jgi:hypothetical protein
MTPSGKKLCYSTRTLILALWGGGESWTCLISK